MSVVEDLPLSLPMVRAGLAREDEVESPDSPGIHSQTDSLPSLSQDKAKFFSYSMGDLPPLELERDDRDAFSSFTMGDLPPIELEPESAADLATMSLPVDTTLAYNDMQHNMLFHDCFVRICTDETLARMEFQITPNSQPPCARPRMRRKGFKKQSLQRRRSHFSSKDLMLDQVDSRFFSVGQVLRFSNIEAQDVH